MPVRVYKLKDGGKVEIFIDENAESPREYDNLGTMAFFHRRYKLGDKHSFDNPIEVREHLAETEALFLPVYMYDHGGIALSTEPFECRWDSGQLGVIYVTKERVIKEYGNFSDASQLHALNVMQAEVKLYDEFVQGNCYGYKKFDASGNETESCWGFIGSNFEQSGLLEAAGVKENIQN